MEELPTNENSPVTLKEASIADIPTLLELEKSVGNLKTYSPMLEEDEWKVALKDGKVYLIEKDGKIIGNLSYEQKGEGHFYFSGLAIHPSFQGQGIARRVLTELLDEVKGAKKIDLVTHPENVAALNLYKSLGFVIESRKENYYGDGEPRLVMSWTKK